MRRFVDNHQLSARRDQPDRFGQFFDRPKRVACAMHKHRGRFDLREVLCAQLLRLSRRMQRIRQQQQSIGELRDPPKLPYSIACRHTSSRSARSSSRIPAAQRPRDESPRDLAPLSRAPARPCLPGETADRIAAQTIQPLRTHRQRQSAWVARNSLPRRASARGRCRSASPAHARTPESFPAQNVS